MRWRDFIAGLGAAGRSFAARAQQRAVPVIGYLSVGPPELSVRNAVVASLLQQWVGVVAEVGQQLPSRRSRAWRCRMPFANDDGRPLGLLVLMRLVSANCFPYRYEGVHDEHSDFAIPPSVPDVGKECSSMCQHYVAPWRDNRNATFHR
jgi:hypothetical protein